MKPVYHSLRKRDPDRIESLLKDAGMEVERIRNAPRYGLRETENSDFFLNRVYDSYFLRAKADKLEADFAPTDAFLLTSNPIYSKNSFYDNLSEKDNKLLDIIVEQYPDEISKQALSAIVAGTASGLFLVGAIKGLDYYQTHTEQVTQKLSYLSDFSVSSMTIGSAAIFCFMAFLAASAFSNTSRYFKKKKAKQTFSENVAGK